MLKIVAMKSLGDCETTQKMISGSNIYLQIPVGVPECLHVPAVAAVREAHGGQVVAHLLLVFFTVVEVLKVVVKGICAVKTLEILRQNVVARHH